MTRRGKRVLLIALGTVIPLVGAEVVLRLVGAGLPVPELRFDYNTRLQLQRGGLVADPELFWCLPLDARVEFDRQIRAVHPRRPVPPKGSKFRILVLGDSCSRLSQEDLPYSALLEQYLGPEQVEVFNASVPGYTSHQGLTWLRGQLADLRADLVLVYLGWNDHWRATGLTDREYAAMQSPWRVRLVDVLRRRHRKPPLRVPLDDFRRNLTEIVRVVERRGGKVLLLTAPAAFSREATLRLHRMGYLAPGDDLPAIQAEYQRTVRQVAAATEARLFDAAQMFDKLDEPRLLLYRDGIHPTDLGHRVLALGLADDIAAHELESLGRVSEDPLAVAARLLEARGREDGGPKP